MIDPLRYAREMSRSKAEETQQMLEELMEVCPGLGEEIERNVEQYGTPTVAGSLGARWIDDLPQDVYTLLNQHYQPLEIVIRPEDQDAHHWEVNWYILKWDDERACYKRVIDIERSKKVSA